MGCHTWYRKLVTNNQKEIIKKVKDAIIVSKSYDWYEFTDLNKLFESKEEWLKEIAEMYKVSETTIYEIKRKIITSTINKVKF